MSNRLIFVQLSLLFFTVRQILELNKIAIFRFKFAIFAIFSGL